MTVTQSTTTQTTKDWLKTLWKGPDPFEKLWGDFKWAAEARNTSHALKELYMEEWGKRSSDRVEVISAKKGLRLSISGEGGLPSDLTHLLILFNE